MRTDAVGSEVRLFEWISLAILCLNGLSGHAIIFARSHRPARPSSLLFVHQLRSMMTGSFSYTVNPIRNPADELLALASGDDTGHGCSSQPLVVCHVVISEVAMRHVQRLHMRRFKRSRASAVGTPNLLRRSTSETCRAMMIASPRQTCLVTSSLFFASFKDDIRRRDSQRKADQAYSSS